MGINSRWKRIKKKKNKETSNSLRHSRSYFFMNYCLVKNHTLKTFMLRKIKEIKFVSVKNKFLNNNIRNEKRTQEIISNNGYLLLPFATEGDQEIMVTVWSPHWGRKDFLHKRHWSLIFNEEATKFFNTIETKLEKNHW